MKTRFGLTSGLTVQLTKNIPLAAGLAGGSSDAAATIKAVNLLYGLKLSEKECAGLGLELGSDIPFFFTSGQVLVSGRGEIFEPVDLPLNYYTVLVTPPVFSSTKEAYELLGRGLTDCEKRSYMTDCRKVEPFFQSLLERTNHFETPLTRKFPVLKEIRTALNNVGARLARMSGSGPTMFGLFMDDPSEGLIYSLNQGQGWRVFIVRPVLLSEK
jgi:4-diphosphocytidyl-2-C-methyl-D-erythritol kinase